MSAAVTHITPPTGQENVPPIDPVVNVRKDARNAMALHIDGSAKESKTGTRRNRLSDPEKIESILASIDCIEALFNLVDDVRLFLESGNASSASIAIDALRYVSSAGNIRLGQIRKATDFTKSKAMAAQAHKKLTKAERQRTSDQQLQRRTLATTNPRRMLQMAISNTKIKLQSSCRQDDPGLESEVTAPRAKRSRLTSTELDTIFTSKERRQIICNDIRLPRPLGGNIVYSAAEAVNVVNTLLRQNSASDHPHPTRTLLVLIKEKMVKERRIPVQICRFNRIIKAAANGDSPQVYWNSRGRPDILPLEKLRETFDEYSKREGVAWTRDQTKDALTNALKTKREEKGLDASTVEPPCNLTVSAYHSALLSMPDLSLRFCNAKCAAREAAETSIRSMLSFMCGILDARSYVCTNIEDIPLEYRFDESRASPGCLLACQLIAQSHNVPENAIQFCAPECMVNIDDMGIYSDFTGSGGCDGKAAEGQQAIVTKTSAQNTSYNNHFAKDDTHQFDGIKIRITNGIAGGGGVLPAFVQVLGFSDAEMPPEKVPKGVLIMKLPRLSASISEDSFGFVVLVRKCAGAETEMFKIYAAEVTLPFISKERLKIARIDDKTEKVPDFLHAVLSTDGGMTQMKALQDLDSLKEKKRRNIDQVKFAKKTSGVTQPIRRGRSAHTGTASCEARQTDGRTSSLSPQSRSRADPAVA